MNELLHGEASPADMPSTPQQAQDVVSEIDNLAGRSAQDTCEPLDKEYNDESFFYRVPADQVPQEIAERFIDPVVDDSNTFGAPEYHLSVSRPRDEFDSPKTADEAWVAWVSLVRKLRRPNGVTYTSPVTYTVHSENNAPIYHLEVDTDLEKRVPERILEAAQMLHVVGSVDLDSLPTDLVQQNMDSYSRILNGLGDMDCEELWEEVGRLDRAAIDPEGLGINRNPSRTLADLTESRDVAREHGLNDVSYPEAESILTLLRSLDLLDQS